MESERTFFVESYDLEVYARGNYSASAGYDYEEFDNLEKAQAEFNSRKDDLWSEFVDRGLYLDWRCLAGVGVRIGVEEGGECETIDVEEIDRDMYNEMRYNTVDDDV